MKKPRVYVDTSVIGGCFDAEFSIWSKAIFHDFESSFLLPVVSEIVVVEIEPAPAIVRSKLDELLRLDPELLSLTGEALELADAYRDRGALPQKFRNDMLHIALASVANCDALVSWNFKHIVRLDKIRVFNGVNLELGYKQLPIYSPREVTSHGRE